MTEVLKDREPMPCAARALPLVRRHELDDWYEVGLARGAEHLLVLEGLQGGPVEPLYVYTQDRAKPPDETQGSHALGLLGVWRSRTVLAVLLLRPAYKEVQLDRVQVQIPFSLSIPQGIACPTLPKGVQLLPIERGPCRHCGK